jgi:hypothetical protein
MRRTGAILVKARFVARAVMAEAKGMAEADTKADMAEADTVK